MRQFALSCVLAASLALPAFAEEVTIATAQGDVTLPAQPQKVAVFDIAAIDSLNALGVAVAGAPDNTYMPYLQDATKDAAKIGTLFEPNLETLAGLGPDLIIIGGRSAAQKAAVEQVGTTIDMTISPDLLTDAKARIDAYGKLFAKTDEEKSRVMFPGLKSSYNGVLSKGQLTLQVPGASGTNAGKDSAANTSLTLSKFLTPFKLTLSAQPAGQSLSLPGLKSADAPASSPVKTK